MKEFIIPLKDAFTKGLNPEGKIDAASNPEQIYGVRVTKSGIKLFNFQSLLDALPNDIGETLTFTALYTDHAISVNPPFPQMLSVGTLTALLTPTRFFYLTSTGGLNEQNLYDAYNTSDVAEALGNNIWQYAVIGDTYILTNGKSCIFKRPSSLKHYVENTIPINACAYYKGHIVRAGFSITSYENDEWGWYRFEERQRVGSLYQSYLTRSSIMWTSVNARDLFWLYYPEEAFEDYEGLEDYDIYRDWLSRNDSGSMTLSSLGEILVLKQLGENLIAYGTKGTAVLGYQVSPFPSLTVEKVFDFRIAYPQSVAGDVSGHLLVSTTGELIYLSVEGPKYLGYGSYFPTSSGPYTVLHNADKQEFYISCATSSFLYNGELVNLQYIATSYINLDGYPLIIYR